MDVQYMCVYMVTQMSVWMCLWVRLCVCLLMPACLCVWCLTGLASLGLFWKIMYCMSGFQSAWVEYSSTFSGPEWQITGNQRWIPDRMVPVSSFDHFFFLGGGLSYLNHLFYWHIFSYTLSYRSQCFWWFFQMNSFYIRGSFDLNKLLHVIQLFRYILSGFTAQISRYKKR